MIKMLRKYAGVIFFYAAVISMIVLVNTRFEELEQQKSANETMTVELAQ